MGIEGEGHGCGVEPESAWTAYGWLASCLDDHTAKPCAANAKRKKDPQARTAL